MNEKAKEKAKEKATEIIASLKNGLLNGCKPESIRHVAISICLSRKYFPEYNSNHFWNLAISEIEKRII